MHDTPSNRLWSATTRLTGVLLLTWALVSVLGPWFARDLNQWQVLGFPLGFWIAGQGALLAYLLIIVVCIVRMEVLEARFQRESAARDRQAPGGLAPPAAKT